MVRPSFSNCMALTLSAFNHSPLACLADGSLSAANARIPYSPSVSVLPRYKLVPIRVQVSEMGRSWGCTPPQGMPDSHPASHVSHVSHASVQCDMVFSIR